MVYGLVRRVVGLSFLLPASHWQPIRPRLSRPATCQTTAFGIAFGMATQTSSVPATVSMISRKHFAPLLGRTAQDGAPAPISAPHHHHHHHRVLKGVVFDVDGTLCIPQTYMFGEMRDALGIDKSVDILDHIYSLPTPAAQQDAMERVRNVERRAMAAQKAQPGLAELMAYLDARGIPKAICTRNFEQPVQHLLGKFLDGHVFAPIVTRDFRPPKPDPAGILHIARSWGLTRTGEETVIADSAADTAVDTAVDKADSASTVSDEEDMADPAVVRAEQKEEEEEEALARATSGNSVASLVPEAPVLEADASGLIMVGDSIDDMTAGRKAGAATVLLVNDVNRHLAEHNHTDLVISRLDELITVLENGFVGREIPHEA